MAPTRRIAIGFVAAFLIGSTINLALEATVPASLLSIRTTESGALSELAVVGQRTVRIKYGFAAALHDVARGGTLVVADPALIAVDDVENLGLMTVVVEDFDPAVTALRAAQLLEMADLTGAGSLTRDEDETTYAIVADEPVTEATRFRMLFFEDAVLVVDERVLARVN